MRPPPPKTGSLSNTIGLQVHLVERGVEDAVAEALCMDIGKLAAKLRGDTYTLMDEIQLDHEDDSLPPDPVTKRRPTYKDVIARGFSGIVGNPDMHIDYIGADDLCGRENSRREQMNLYRMLDKRTLREILNLSGGLKRDASRGPEEDARRHLRKEVNRALGTHKLRYILDQTYGHVFSKILKENIADLWFGYGDALITAARSNDVRRVEHYARFCPMMTKILPLGRHAAERDRWICLVYRGKTQEMR